MDYTKKTLDIFRNPKNMGEMPDADGIGRVGNPTCGDIMYLYLKVGADKNGREIVRDVKVKTFGCVAAIATSSILTEMIKGKTLERAESFTKKDIVDELGFLPPQKLHCSVLAIDALKRAVEDYKKRRKAKPKGGKDPKSKKKMPRAHARKQQAET